MFIIIGQHGFDHSEDPHYRAIGIFKDRLIAEREKRKIEEAIAYAIRKGEKDGQFKYMDCNKKHPYWKYVLQLDPGFDPSFDLTEYSIHSAPVVTVL